MTALPRLSVSDASSSRPGDVLLGEDWVSPETRAEPEVREHRGRRGLVSLKRSPLARKIIIFNMLALVILSPVCCT